MSVPELTDGQWAVLRALQEVNDRGSHLAGSSTAAIVSQHGQPELDTVLELRSLAFKGMALRHALGRGLVAWTVTALGRKMLGDEAAAPVIGDGGTVIVDGRRYRLQVDAPNCESRGHFHSEPHLDGLTTTERHHHHDPRCSGQPRQATLYPLWETEPRHVHEFGPPADGTEHCGCGAWRQHIPSERHQPGKRACYYRMPADAEHPRGWGYEQMEDAGA